MVEVREVVSKKDLKIFMEYPLKLYKDCPYYVPILNIDEKPKLVKDFYCNCHTKLFLAYRDGEVVGRICGIIQTLCNKINSEKKIRFSRFDCINDKEVSYSLLKAVEDWGRENGLDTIHGPMGFNDLDREGLLIEGFDQLGTYEEQYNYEYYKDLLEDYGFEKDVDWIEYKIFKPKEINERVERLAKAVMKRYELNYLEVGNISMGKFIKKYQDDIFEVLDEAYAPLYGVVPTTDDVKKEIISQFKTILNKNFIKCVVNKKGKIIAFGLALPRLSEVAIKTKGKIFPFGFLRVLWQVHHCNSVDLGLIGVKPEYQNKGVNAILLYLMMKGMIDLDLEFAETNLMLEYNTKIQSQWEMLDYVQNKRRRSFIKKIV